MVARSRLREILYRLNENAESPIRQTAIVEATKLSPKTISGWMNHKRPITRIDVPSWVAIAQYLGVEPSELLIFDSDQNG